MKNNKIIIYSLIFFAIFGFILRQLWSPPQIIPNNFFPETAELETNDLDDTETVDLYEEVDNSSRFEKLRY